MGETYECLNLFLDFLVIGILILGIWLFRWPHWAKLGNLTAAFALTLGAGLVLYRNGIYHLHVVTATLVVGSGLGYWVARRITMIQIPAMVAFQNGAGGAASFCISFVELMRTGIHLEMINGVSGVLGLAIGAVTFSGSMVACGKLSNTLAQKPRVFFRHTWLVMVNFAAIVLFMVAALYVPAGGRVVCYLAIIMLSVLFGVLFSIRIGGADMPVLISLLNAMTGMAAAFCGMIIGSKLLISCGAMVGASGSILTHVMCRAMNRSLFRIFVPVEKVRPVLQPEPLAEPEQAAVTMDETDQGGETAKGADQNSDSENTLLRVVEIAGNARRIIIVPGYGMAVAQAQFEVLEFLKHMLSMGKQVKFAIHPVAGRMPGHMNVLLAEAGVDYDLLYEMDAINTEFSQTDLALVIGASDVVNPAAMAVDDSPISGMPVLLVQESKHVVCCNLDDKPGYSGVANPLYLDSRTTMLFGDARKTLKEINGRLSQASLSQDSISELRTAADPVPGLADIDNLLDKALAALVAAEKIIVIPGYGMAMAQAQFKVVELASLLEGMGKEVKFAIHPVAGRMPGHMNVLLAEAEVDYGKLYEMDEINSEFLQTDVAIVFGACDVVNPTAMAVEGTPLSGMPILMAQDAKQIIVCNFDEKPGYSGVENSLYQNPKTIMVLGDAALTARDLINGIKQKT